MTCEAKGSIIRDVKVGYNSCVAMSNEVNECIFLVVTDDEID